MPPFFFFNDPATTEIYTLSLHDALPISSTTFAAGQVRYELRQQWHGLAEYRWLDVKDGGTRQGWLLGVDRDINRNFRIGAGYNFTDFSDNLTNFDYDHKGWFVNLTGQY